MTTKSALTGLCAKEATEKKEERISIRKRDVYVALQNVQLNRVAILHTVMPKQSQNIKREELVVKWEMKGEYYSPTHNKSSAVVEQKTIFHKYIILPARSVALLNKVNTRI